MNAPSPTDPNCQIPTARVLVAEDDQTTRAALVSFLNRHGFEVTIAEDGRAALGTLMGPNPPQIALLDWEMPRLDGLDVCGAVRSLPHGESGYTYMIMLTARDQPDDMLAAHAAGIDDFLSKPVDSAQLLAKLRCGERVLEWEGRCQDRISQLEETVEELKQRQRILPLCMYCNKVRDEDDVWHETEPHVGAHSATAFSECVCPECVGRLRARRLLGDRATRAKPKLK